MSDKINREKFAYKPLISILIPTYNVDKKWLQKCIESIENQWYDNWEVCIADDASTKKETIEYLKSLQNNSKYHSIFRKNHGHISEATKDKIDENDNRFDAHFKPDWSPSLILNQNYISHLGVYRTDISRNIGGFRKGFEGCQDHDFVLRFVECIKDNQIKHIPKILYHWRAISTSTAANGNQKEYAFNNGDNTIQHGGVILGTGGVAGHTFINSTSNDPGYFSRLYTDFNYTAVTAACLMVSKNDFNKVNGFDEKLEVAFNDVDLCIRVYQLGRYNVWAHNAELYHYESKSRGLEDTPEKIKRFNSPIWTNAKDIKWYQAKKQKDGTWTVHMDIKNHSNHLGKYTTHVYMTANDGRETARNLGQTEIVGQPLELTGKIINVNSKAGSYDVVVNASAPSGVKSVRVLIWTNAKDIKWYQAKKQKDGTWTVHMDIRNHNYSKGSYTTHVYMTSNDGHETAISLNKKVEFDLPVDGFVTQIKDIDKNTGTYTVIIDVSKNINVSKVSVPTWNTLNKNVVWYNAEKVGVSIYKATISVKNHNNLSGTYVSHVYVTDNSNNTISKVAGNVVLDNDYESKYGKKLVFLDPGHGGYDSGAVSSSGTKEKDITLSVSNLVKNKLSTAGYQVIMSRYDDRYIDFVTERSRMSNVANADIFVSIHVNSGGGGVAQGVEVYWYEYDSAYPPQINQAYHNDPIRLRNSERLANSIQSNIIKQTSAINRGIRRQTYAVVREAKAPAVLVETGYIDNRSEELRLKSAKYQEKLAQGIVDGIKQYFNN